MKKIIYTYSKNNKICKFYLKNKCKYRQIGVNELNQLLVQLKDLKLENKSLRSELQINNQRISNLQKKRNKRIMTSVMIQYMH
jgi:hypothetical protein